jgi:hypothetical protein
MGIGIDRPRVGNEKDKKFGQPEPLSPTVTLFWMKYKEVKPLLDKYNASHPGNKFNLIQH